MIKIFGSIATRISEYGDKYRIWNYKKLINGSGYRLGDKVFMAYPKNISIGNGTYINSGYVMASPNAQIRIGENCLISYNVHIRTDMHEYMDKNRLINIQGNSERDIIIEDDVWIGFGAQIMPGVTLKRGSVVGGGAVVTHSTEEYGVYAGVPAKKIKERE